MTNVAPEILYTLETIIFTSIVLLHLVKKNSTAIFLYIAQSLSIAILLFISSFEEMSVLLLVAIVSTVVVKVIIAPYFFFKLIKKHTLTFSVSTFWNMPMTLLIIAGITALTHASFFQPLTLLTPSGKDFILISFSTILISLFLIINRKGALSQMLGILSLENGIVSFALFAGLEQSPALQLGITFNISIWIIIGTVFVSMIYKKYGSLDVTNMKDLTE